MILWGQLLHYGWQNILQYLYGCAGTVSAIRVGEVNTMQGQKVDMSTRKRFVWRENNP